MASGAGFAPAYGNDATTQKTRELFAEIFETNVAVAFVPTGSAANGVGLSLLTPPFGAVVCHDHAHVLIDECGAPEFYTGGAKLLPAAGIFGKLRSETVRTAMMPYDPPMAHRVRPSVLSITQATEWGTVYTPAEIQDLSETARSYGMMVHMDGARFAGAVNATGASPADLTWRSGVNILSLGGTKNGCLCAEAVVVFDPSKEDELAYRCKRAGLGTSKQRYFSAQWQAYFADDLWLELARQSHACCRRLAEVMNETHSIERLVDPAVNELFVRMPHDVAKTLRAAGAQFYDWVQPADAFAGEARRFLTSWETTDAQLSQLSAALPR